MITMGVCITNTINAQSYQSFPTDSAVWSVVTYLGTTPENGHFFETTHYGVVGDTLINSKVYHKIASNTKFVFKVADGDNIYEGAFRESNKIIFWVKKGMVTEDTLYNFNLTVGDSLQCQNGSYIDTIQHIDSIALGFNYHKRYNLGIDSSYHFLGTFPTSIVEGVGGLARRKVFPFEDCQYQERSVLLCFKRNGILLYQDDYLDTCYYFSGFNSLDENTLTKRISSIYPNPFNEKFSVRFMQLEPKAMITVSNTLGEVVLRKKMLWCRLIKSLQNC